MRLSPHTFWAMSLNEWRAAVNGFAQRSQGAAPLARGEFDHMMRMYPDHLPRAPANVGERGKG